MNEYINTILEKSNEKISKVIDDEKLRSNFIKQVHKINDKKRDKVITEFIKIYNKTIKKSYQNKTPYNKKLYETISHNKRIKVVWGDCYDFLNQLPSESIHLMVTSPPYYNAREYSQWSNLNEYLAEMKRIIQECFRVLDNNRVFVFNVGDVFDNDNLKVKSTWGKRRLPLGAYFIRIFEECGFTFVDDYIWDKGEVQSQRHKNGSKPYPFYQYPVNCYEHILVFHKHRLDKTPYPCPICGCLNVNGNSQSEINLQSWECKNPDCFVRSKCNRGKRFSSKTNMVQNQMRHDNTIDHNLITKWRKDIIKFQPVFKINQKGENTVGHTAPFPKDIPEMAVNFFSYKGDIVLDPFAGSFTVPIVSQKLERIGIGVEKRKDLFEKPILSNLNKHNVKFDITQV